MPSVTAAQKQELGSAKTTFLFSTGTPVDFGALVVGDQIIDAEITIDVPFDDPTALLALGLVSNPGSLLPTNAVDPQTAGTYHNGENILITGSDQIRLQITPGTSTQGSGRVVVTVRNA